MESFCEVVSIEQHDDVEALFLGVDHSGTRYTEIDVFKKRNVALDRVILGR